ncbi:MAG: glycosyltransferase family 2 protein [Candidatus Binatia bacterium]|nr:glycosyltransferase family 2 protein [Candidatus Binatia bacterium]
MAARVSVTLVTFDSAEDLPRCLDALAAQTQAPAEVIVVDNASSDGSAGVAERHAVVTRVERNTDNRGFAAGQNQALGHAGGDWVLVLNPDVTLGPGFLEALGEHFEAPPALGTLCGKLLRAEPDGSPRTPPTLDSAGVVFERSFRHLDRGSEARDDGQFDRLEPVFGATGAAACYRRDMIEDVSIEGEFFDEAFFAYREDADLAWRAQLLGWDCLYVPKAVGYHVRRVLPANRRGVAAVLNRHSVKNRFLMRIKNADSAVILRCGARGVARDLLVLGGCLTTEWSSLPAFMDVARLWPRARRQRKVIQARRRRDPSVVAGWFT